MVWVVLILLLGEILSQLRQFVCISDIKLTMLRQFVQDYKRTNLVNCLWDKIRLRDFVPR